eukprot:58595_1
MSVQDENTSWKCMNPPVMDPLNTQYVQISPIIHAKKEESLHTYNLIKNRNVLCHLCDSKLITNNKYVRITLENTDTTTFYHQCRAITIDNAEYDPLLICQQTISSDAIIELKYASTQITRNRQYIAEYSMDVSNNNSRLCLIESSGICTFAQETACVTFKLPAQTQLKKNMLASRMINLANKKCNAIMNINAFQITTLPPMLNNVSISPVAVPSETNQTNNSCKNNRNSKQQNRESG